MNRFKAGLHRFYQSIGEGVIFLETALLKTGASASARQQHTRVEVVPMEKEVFEDAHLFFRKAVNDFVEEGNNTNKSLIDTTGKGLRRCVPSGFSYFHVSWAGGGLVHPIEEEREFPLAFGMDVAAGMMGLGPSRMGRREGRRRSAEEDAREAKDFAAKWEAFLVP